MATGCFVGTMDGILESSSSRDLKRHFLERANISRKVIKPIEGEGKILFKRVRRSVQWGCASIRGTGTGVYKKEWKRGLSSKERPREGGP